MPLIAFEGLDGSGKSTLIRAVSERLARHAPLLLREPGGTLLGDQLRALVRGGSGVAPTDVSELMLFAAARHQLVSERIDPALIEGRLVLIDRFTDSTVAYQAFGRGLDLDAVLRVVRLSSGGIDPQLTVLLELDESVRRERLSARGSMDRFESAGAAFDRRVAEGYRHLVRGAPERFLCLDAAKPVADLADAVCAELASRAIASAA